MLPPCFIHGRRGPSDSFEQPYEPGVTSVGAGILVRSGTTVRASVGIAVGSSVGMGIGGTTSASCSTGHRSTSPRSECLRGARPASPVGSAAPRCSSVHPQAYGQDGRCYSRAMRMTLCERRRRPASPTVLRRIAAGIPGSNESETGRVVHLEETTP
jgi:hypothetical protein